MCRAHMSTNAALPPKKREQTSFSCRHASEQAAGRTCRAAGAIAPPVSRGGRVVGPRTRTRAYRTHQRPNVHFQLLLRHGNVKFLQHSGKRGFRVTDHMSDDFVEGLQDELNKGPACVGHRCGFGEAMRARVEEHIAPHPLRQLRCIDRAVPSGRVVRGK